MSLAPRGEVPPLSVSGFVAVAVAVVRGLSTPGWVTSFSPAVGDNGGAHGKNEVTMPLSEPLALPLHRTGLQASALFSAWWTALHPLSWDLQGFAEGYQGTGSLQVGRGL